jgi:uncharacterized protein (DUF2141 family)
MGEKKMKTLFAISIILSAVFSFAQEKPTLNHIYIEISGISEIKGDISIGLFNSAETFPKNGKAFKGQKIKVESSKVSGVFEDVPAGKYALAIYHDENANGKLDRNFLGIPKEDYVFSNNASGALGPPSFEDAMFKVQDSVHLKLKFKDD